MHAIRVDTAVVNKVSVTRWTCWRTIDDVPAVHQSNVIMILVFLLFWVLLPIAIGLIIDFKKQIKNGNK